MTRVDRQHRTRTLGTRVVIGIIVAVALLANIAGYRFQLYDRWGWFDKVLHAYTLFAITFVVGRWTYGRVLTGAQQHPLLSMSLR